MKLRMSIQCDPDVLSRQLNQFYLAIQIILLLTFSCLIVTLTFYHFDAGLDPGQACRLMNGVDGLIL